MKRGSGKELLAQSSQIAGYSGTPLWKKLGYKSGVTAYLDGAPIGYIALLTLPPDILIPWLASPKSGMGLVHLFVTSSSSLKAKAQLYRKRIAPDGMIWVSWPKKSSGVPTDITESIIRDIVLPLGLVDIKVCAVDGVWSGLKLMIRKELR